MTHRIDVRGEPETRGGQRELSNCSCAKYVSDIHLTSIQSVLPNSVEDAAAYAQKVGNGDTFGDRLKARLEERGLPQAGLAKGLKAVKGGHLGEDLQRAAVNGWITGKGFPNVIQLAEICRRLDISADELLFGKASEPGASARQAVAPESPESEVRRGVAAIAAYLSDSSEDVRALVADMLPTIAKKPPVHASVAAAIIAAVEPTKQAVPLGGSSSRSRKADKTGTDG